MKHSRKVDKWFSCIFLHFTDPQSECGVLGDAAVVAHPVNKILLVAVGVAVPHWVVRRAR